MIGAANATSTTTDYWNWSETRRRKSARPGGAEDDAWRIAMSSTQRDSEAGAVYARAMRWAVCLFMLIGCGPGVECAVDTDCHDVAEICVANACAPRGTSSDGGGSDAGPRDAAVSDGGPRDAAAVDAAMSVDAGSDSGI